MRTIIETFTYRYNIFDVISKLQVDISCSLATMSIKMWEKVFEVVEKYNGKNMSNSFNHWQTSIVFYLKTVSLTLMVVDHCYMIFFVCLKEVTWSAKTNSLKSLIYLNVEKCRWVLVPHFQNNFKKLFLIYKWINSIEYQIW